LIVRYIITGPPTHSVGGQYCFAFWRLSSSVTLQCICSVTHQGAARDGGPVVSRPVRATPCLIYVSISYILTFITNNVRTAFCAFLRGLTGSGRTLPIPV